LKPREGEGVGGRFIADAVRSNSHSVLLKGIAAVVVTSSGLFEA